MPSETDTFSGWAIVEEWRPVVGFEALYEVSSGGAVRRVGSAARTERGGRGGGARQGRMLRIQSSLTGYRRVQLWRDGHPANVFVHSLVAAAFLGDCPDGCDVNHVDGDKEHNAAGNLEYVTRSENNRHAYRTGLRPTGEQHSAAKLSEADVHAIRAANREGVGCRRLAAHFGVCKQTVQLIIKGRNWAHLPEVV